MVGSLLTIIGKTVAVILRVYASVRTLTETLLADGCRGD